MSWYYRIARKYTLSPEKKQICKHSTQEHLTPDASGTLKSTHGCYKKTGRMKKNYFYCVVEFFPRVPKPVGKALHSTNPEWPSGDTRKECIQSLEMMLKDAKHYPTLIEKDKWNPEWCRQSIRVVLEAEFSGLIKKLTDLQLEACSVSDLRKLHKSLFKRFE